MIKILFSMDVIWAIIITASSVILAILIFFERVEKLIAIIYKFFGFLKRGYVRHDLQSKINDYLKKISKKVKHIHTKKVKIRWINLKKETEKQYIQDGKMIIRLKEGDHQNENIVRASMAVISYAFLKKAKTQIAKYQRESLDLYVCYDLLKKEEKSEELLNQFVQDFLNDKMNNEKVGAFFEKCSDINDAGIFYPVLVQELTFLGEKAFAKKRDANKIYEEVANLVTFLHQYAHRKIGAEDINNFTGAYCKFGIRIIGKSYKVKEDDTQIYVNHLKKVSQNNETLYLIGDKKHKKFMNTVFNDCKKQLNYSLLSEETYKATIKDAEGNDKKVQSYLMTIRNNNIQVFHKQ